MGMAEAVKLSGAADALAALIARDGTATHPFAMTKLLGNSATQARDLADVVHHLSIVYGRYPCIADIELERTTKDHLASHWLEDTVAGFQAERQYLNNVVVAAGPLPSTPGHAQSDAIDMLAKSDRSGCALGATLALACDWRAIRKVIDTAARRFGIDSQMLLLPLPEEAFAIADIIAEQSPAAQRAMMFGAQQILVQNRGLWDLLEARLIARGAE
jgi:hypothetical protein